MLTSAQRAYALLWRSSADCGFVQMARRELLSTLTRDEQREAIAWVLKDAGPMTDAEMIAADMRAGIFPRRSHQA